MLNVVLTTYWYCCPWGVLLHGLHILFHFIPSWYYDSILSETNRWLEHPALLAGCVCVCTFSKEVKLVPVVGCWTSYWLLIDIYVLEEFFYMFHSLFHSTAAGGWSMTQKSPTNEDASDVIVIWFWDAGITYLPSRWAYMVINKCLDSFWFSCLASCCFELTKEHLLSWLWHLMPQFLLKCVCVKAPRNTVLWFFKNNFFQQGAGAGGGGFRPTKTPPPPGANVPAFFLFRKWQEAKPRTSFFDPFSSRTTLWPT